MKNRVAFLFLAILFSLNLNGQLFCPSDVTSTCFTDLTLEEFGNATVVSGNYHQSQVKYEDDNQTNACNEGVVLRRFYIDTDYNNAFTEGEPFCVQTITLVYEELPLNIQFPSEVTINCLDELPMQHPTWSHHPCDLVGYSYEDEVFDFEDGACQKIVRTFQVINWCEYDGNNNEGLYTGVQIIKVIDNEAPEINGCQDVVFDAVENCEAEIVLTNAATDIGDCPSGKLQWTLSVDLWGDGTEDLFYGPNEPIPFRIDKVANGEEVSISLPESLAISNNKLVWKVTDGCGNVRSCSSRFEVQDNKAPTPYCYSFLSATLDGQDDGQLVIPATLYNNGALDNCSSSEEITISFSENVEDTERVIECGEIGFQFYRIYHTDAAGNQDFCEVFMFVLDNGSCGGKFEPMGRVFTSNGEAVDGVTTYLMEGHDMVAQSMTNTNGDYDFGEQSLMDTYYAKAEKLEDPMLGVDLVDYQLMVDAALGKVSLDYYSRIAADMDEDGKFTINDLDKFRSVLIGDLELTEEESLKFIPIDTDINNTNAVYDPYMSIMDYQNGFNFWAVKKGDLTGAQNIEEQEEETITLDFTIEDNQITISNPSTIETGFFSLDILADNDDVINNTPASKVYENVESIKIMNLENESVALSPKDLKLSIAIESKEDGIGLLENLINEVSFINKNHDGLVDVNWNIVDKRDAAIEQPVDQIDVKVYPTVFDNKITIEGNDISKVTLRAVNGSLINANANSSENRVELSLDQSLVHGIYFLTIESGGNKKFVKLVK